MEAAEYERLAAAEDRLWYFRALRERVIDALRRTGVPDNAVVLDAGCGTGGMLRGLSAWSSGAVLRGIDVSPLACERAAAAGFDVREGSVEEIPFGDGEFDAIVSLDVLTQVEVPLLALVEFFRCLKPGGVLVLNGAALPWLWSYHDERVQSRRRLTRRRTLALVREAGLRVEFATYWNCFLLPLVAARRKLLPRRDGSSDVRPPVPVVNELCLGVAWLERLLNRTGLPLPIGSSLFVVARRPARVAKVRLQ
ncbi:MAG: class I SAM-dependent methyltransferase [Verrucomicrobia bacterium]|nr:MAG: class I SAM-dependent methyltransferase [Verrucomicrobiota bacterium]